MKTNYLVFLIIGLCLQFFMALNSHAGESDKIKIKYAAYADSVQFLDSLQFYFEKDAEIATDDIEGKQFTSNFSQVKMESDGCKRYSIWLKGFFVNRTDTPLTVLMNLPNLMQIDIFSQVDGKLIPIARGGQGCAISKTQPTVSYTPFPFFKILPRDTLAMYARLFNDGQGLGSTITIHSPGSADMEVVLEKNHFSLLFKFRYAFIGVIIFQLIYIFIQLLIKRRKEYLFYMMYIFSIVLFFWMRLEIVYWDYFFWAFLLDNSVSVITAANFMCFLFYFGFGRHFLNLEQHLPKLNLMVKINEISLAILVVFLIIAPYLNIWIDHNIVLWIGGILLFIISVVFIGSALKIRDITAYYFLAGSLIYAISSLLAFLIRNLKLIELSNTFDSIIFLECGMLAEMLFFTSGLAHKEILIQKQKILAEQQLIKEKESKEFEKRMALKEERDRISKELHDDLGAQLSTAKMFLNNFRENAPVGSSLNLVENSLSLIDGSISDLRKIMDDLHVSAILEKGFLIAAEELVNKVNELQQIQFTLSHSGLKQRLDPKLEHNLFRITQELINNTLKYANAEKVTIDLLVRDEKFILFFEDDGIGFDLDKTKRGNGLSNIESRARSMGGEADFDSQPGAGSRTTIEMPLLYATAKA